MEKIENLQETVNQKYKDWLDKNGLEVMVNHGKSALLFKKDGSDAWVDEKSFDLVIYSGGIYSFKEFKKMTSLVKEEMKQRKFKVKYVRPGWVVHPVGKYVPFALRIYGR